MLARRLAGGTRRRRSLRPVGRPGRNRRSGPMPRLERGRFARHEPSPRPFRLFFARNGCDNGRQASEQQGHGAHLVYEERFVDKESEDEQRQGEQTHDDADSSLYFRRTRCSYLVAKPVNRTEHRPQLPTGDMKLTCARLVGSKDQRGPTPPTRRDASRESAGPFVHMCTRRTSFRSANPTDVEASHRVIAGSPVPSDLDAGRRDSTTWMWRPRAQRHPSGMRL